MKRRTNEADDENIVNSPAWLMNLPDTARAKVLMDFDINQILSALLSDERLSLWANRVNGFWNQIWMTKVLPEGQPLQRVGNNDRYNCLAWYAALGPRGLNLHFKTEEQDSLMTYANDNRLTITFSVIYEQVMKRWLLNTVTTHEDLDEFSFGVREFGRFFQIGIVFRDRQNNEYDTRVAFLTATIAYLCFAQFGMKLQTTLVLRNPNGDFRRTYNASIREKF